MEYPYAQILRNKGVKQSSWNSHISTAGKWTTCTSDGNVEDWVQFGKTITHVTQKNMHYAYDDNHYTIILPCYTWIIYIITSLIFVYFSDILAIERLIWMRKYGKLFENKARPRMDFILGGMSYITNYVCKN